MSARAAWRLESLGFTHVYRYTPGKVDWLAFDLPWEGKKRQETLSGDVADAEVPTCGLQDRMEDVQQRVRQAGWRLCVVVNAEKVVLGILDDESLNADPQQRVDTVMNAAPKTYRPHTPAKQALGYMQRHHQDYVLVTRSDGVLLGALQREDIADTQDAAD